MRGLAVGGIVVENAPRSVVRELARLCEPEIVVCAQLGELPSVPYLARIACVEQASRLRKHARGVFVRVHPLEGTVAVTMYNLLRPKDLLSLLSQLAILSASSRRAVEPPAWIREGLGLDVARIVCLLQPQLSEGLLAMRLAVSPSTLWRWFANEGTVSPRLLIKWMQAYLVAERLMGSTESMMSIADGLGFKHAESMCRLVRTTSGVATRHCRRGNSAEYFAKRMKEALRDLIE
jgi:AraC-like DNA-binding protein